jgi:hypothetical protein
MSWAAIAGAGISAAGGIFSSIFGGNAQIKAMREAAEIAERTALTLDNRARKDLQPFRQMGITAGQKLMTLLSGEADPSAVMQESALYRWQRDQGYRDINRQLSARGLQRSGAGLETLARFTNQLTAEEGQRYYDRLSNLTTLGSNAAARMATNTVQTGNNLAGIQGQLGQATAGAIGAQYQGVGNVISGIGGTIAQWPLYDATLNMLKGMGGGGSGSINLPAIPSYTPPPNTGQTLRLLGPSS